MKHPVLFIIFLALMLVGNCVGAYKLFTAPGSIMTQNPKVTEGVNPLNSITIPSFHPEKTHPYGHHCR